MQRGVARGHVESLNHEGWGVVRAGKVVFVHGALPGEEVEYRIRRRERSHDEAELLQVISPSAERVTPECAHFGRCGGCALQHLSSASQRQHKDEMLRETLRRIGKLVPEQWYDPLAGEAFGYRRRARLGARYVHARGASLVGFRERLSSYVAALDRCLVLAPPVGELLVPLSQLISTLSIPTRIPQIEVAVADRVTVLVIRILSPLNESDREKLLAFELTHQVRWLLQTGRPDQLETLQGDMPELDYALAEFGLRLRFEPADFIQVNGAVNEMMVRRVVELLQLQSDSRVLDLFCGLGNFTLPIATRAPAVYGLEGDAGLVQRARENAERNGLPHARFAATNLAGEDAAERCLTLLRGERFDRVLLDPPRTGAIDILPAVAQMAPQRIIYVSCNPATLARDLEVLVQQHGYKLTGSGIVDMFPQTSHVESIAVLDAPRKKGAR